ncbi:MAG: anaerobic ribonucleoside-triphosphate reductase activating protein [Alphaproteobacteria bacterium]|nr:anaerobic ribonucleoside-triphosphate reductase activating protein [Alphaproteobacteria bacterium]
MNNIQIGGLVAFTTIDYPGKLAAVLFLVGCPLKCEYCSNRHLIPSGEGEYDPEKVFDWLKSRTGKLEAVVFSGGEALLHGPALYDYMKRVRDMGFAIGLHTNGFYPDRLSQVAELVDWIGLDYKATKTNYEKLTGVNIAYDQMIKSLDIWLKTGKPFEVRITCDPRFVSKSDLLDIAHDVSKRGVKNFAVQRYVPHFESEGNTTTAAMRDVFFSDKELRQEINSLFESVIWRE